MSAGIDASLYDEVRPVFEPGERLLWAGRPAPFRTAREKIVQAMFGALFILLIFLMYVSGLFASGPYFGAASVPFTLRPAILSAAAFLALFGALFLLFAYWAAQRTVYAVTDRRVLSLTRGRPARMVRYVDMQVPLLNLRRDGSGDIHFNGKSRADGTEHQPQFPRFVGVGAAETVYQLVLGRMQDADDDATASCAVHDYLELLLQGKRTLDEDAPRE